MPKVRSPKISKSFLDVELKNREPKTTSNPSSYKNYNISWNIGLIDFESEYGLNVIKGKIRFEYTHDIFSAVFEAEDEKLCSKLEKINGTVYDSVDAFFNTLHIGLPNPIPNSVIKAIIKNISFTYFMNELFPQIKSVEGCSWMDIENATHNGKSNSHFVDVKNLIPWARKRLEELGYKDRDQLYSLRLQGKLRLYGIRDFTCLKIIWIDTEHKIYPSHRG